MTRVYLDHAATTPLRPEVLAAMLPWLADNFGNANSLYREGKQARLALDDARGRIAALIGASPTELVFTSGGTEANNLLISGIVQAIRQQRGREKGGNHIVSTAFEHHAVLEPARALKRAGFEVALARPSRDGYVTADRFRDALRPDTMLASVMMAQNEIGSLQPLSELAAIAHGNGTLLHSDAVQALGKVRFNVCELGIDAASFSAHKLGGPKGVGAFYLRQQTPFVSSLLGGGQEGSRRSGTQNVAGAVGFAKALELAEAEREQESQRLAGLRSYLAASLLALSPRILLTLPLEGHSPVSTSAPAVAGTPASGSAVSGLTPAPEQLPHILSFLVAGQESETLVMKLDDAGFAVSGGSACSTGSLEPSHVLLSLGIPRDAAYGAIRISLGRGNSKADIDRFCAALAALL